MFLLVLKLLATCTAQQHGSTAAPAGGTPLWIPDLPAAPLPHPENTRPNQLYEPSIPGQPVVSEIQATSLRLSWSPPLQASTGDNAPPATIQSYRIYQQEYQWTTNAIVTPGQGGDGGSHPGGTTPSDLHTDTLRYETAISESSHPYLNNQDRTTLLAFPGAVNLTIQFHSNTDLEQTHDWLQFLPTVNNPPNSIIHHHSQAAAAAFDLPTAKFTGRAAHTEAAYQSDQSQSHHGFDSVVFHYKPFTIQGDRCLVRFYSDGSVGLGNGTNPNSRWGYRFTATATFLVQTPAFIGGFARLLPDFNGQYTTQVVHALKVNTF